MGIFIDDEVCRRLPVQRWLPVLCWHGTDSSTDMRHSLLLWVFCPKHDVSVIDRLVAVTTVCGFAQVGTRESTKKK
jgi:hypothetical protein